MSIATDLDEPDWLELLRGVQTNLQARIHTALPGVVRSYDVATQTADVQLAVQLNGHSVPPLSGIPVLWPGGAAGVLHIPLSAGDSVLVVFAEEDFSRWLVTGSVSAPAVLARHGLHAIAIPGRLRTPAVVTGGHVTLAAAAELHLGSDAATAFVALATLVDAQLSAIRTILNAHVHSGVTTGPGASGPLVTPLPALTSVAATKVRAI